MFARFLTKFAYISSAVNRRLFVSLQRLRGAWIGGQCSLEPFECNSPQRISIGNSCLFESGISIKINHPFATGYCLMVADSVRIRRNCEFNISSLVRIGARTGIASNVTFVDVNHEFQGREPVRDQPIVAAAIEIGEDCWIGTGAIILPGVTIGKGSVIGAGAVVNKSIPEYEVWAGVPAKKIKSR